MRNTEHSQGLVAVFVLGLIIVPLGLFTGEIALLAGFMILQSVVFAFHTHQVKGSDATQEKKETVEYTSKSKETLISECIELNQEYREHFTDEEKEYVDRLLTRYMSKEEYQTAMDLKSYLLHLMSKYY